MHAPSTRTRRVLGAWGLAFLAVVAPAAAAATEAPPAPPDPAATEAGAAGPSPACPPGTDAIVVLTRPHELWLCARDAPAARYPIALGKGGLGKRSTFDGRTPLGTYPLGAPRPSVKYGTFIPIGYPTPAQAARGFTGYAVGIHGPPRGMDDAHQYPVTEVDWTAGCVATGNDAAIATIAEFVRKRRPRVVIR